MKRNFLQDENRKKYFLEVLSEKTKRFQWQLLFWVILDNHYHILIKSEKYASALVKLISQLHTNIARQCNKLDRVKGRKVWWNYWDSCITYERSFLTRINYIHYNPVKHGYVNEPGDYLFSSYKTFMMEYPQEGKSIQNKFSFDNVKIKDDF